MALFFDRQKENQQMEMKTKFRVSIIDDDSHKEIFTFRSSKMTIIISIAGAAVLIMFLTYFITAHTGLRRTIPGYPSSETRDAAVANLLKIDSLERAIDLWAFQVANIQRAITGETPISIDSISVGNKSENEATADMTRYALSDSILREDVLKQEQANTSTTAKNSGNKTLLFFKPADGLVTEGFNRATGHTFIEISAGSDAMVYAVDEGTVISDSWSDSDGYSIFIQHHNNIVSIYRHNYRLFMHTGDKVTAGTPIALAGSTGSNASHPTLRFEIWQGGEAVDPSLYINF